MSAALEVDQTQLNRLFLNLVRIGETHGVRFPREFGLFLKQLLYFDRYTRILAPQLQVRSEMCSCSHHKYGVLLMLHFVLYFHRYTHILAPQLYVRNKMCGKCNVWCAPVPEKAIILWPLHAFWRHSYRCGVIVCACS